MVRRTEADFNIVPCFGTGAGCTIQPDCVLAGILDEALLAFLAVLDRYTLADLVAPRAALVRLLRMNVAAAEIEAAPPPG